MANTFELGGSPLGLIGVKSRPTLGNMSTFTGGESRNVNVDAYNSGRRQTSNIVINGERIETSVSLFTGDSIPNFWGNLSIMGTDQDTTGISREYNGFNRNDLHNDSVYDTSMLNIIEKLSFSPKASLRPQDFAYLKNLGVFPNNRLMIARRFTEPQKDNIMDKGGTRPLAVLISWKPQDEDFIDFTYGEKWMNSEADFTNVLNRVGKDVLGSKLGDGIGKGFNIIPFTGLTEVLQRELLTSMGILNNDRDKVLPSGNPNIIKIAKRRKLVGYGEADSGLETNISIKMKVEYEQKFLSGIDPTVAWMDIMNNALSFGTSVSTNYGLNEEFSKNIKKWTGKGGPNLLVKDFAKKLSDIFSNIKNKVVDIINGISKLIDGDGNNNEENTEKNNEADKAGNIIDGLVSLISDSLEATVRKYQVELMGIVHSLSGLPSTPWHITIGNPLRPVFCSGDMLTEDVSVKLGPTLAFNDLPTNITVEFTLKNARPLGLQEILAKFNTGYLRAVNIRKDYLSTNIINDGNSYFMPLGETENNSESLNGESSSSQASNGNLVVLNDSEENTFGPQRPPTTKENSE